MQSPRCCPVTKTALRRTAGRSFRSRAQRRQHRGQGPPCRGSNDRLDPLRHPEGTPGLVPGPSWLRRPQNWPRQIPRHRREPYLPPGSRRGIGVPGLVSSWMRAVRRCRCLLHEEAVESGDRLCQESQRRLPEFPPTLVREWVRASIPHVHLLPASFLVWVLVDLPRGWSVAIPDASGQCLRDGFGKRLVAASTPATARRP